MCNYKKIIIFVNIFLITPVDYAKKEAATPTAASWLIGHENWHWTRKWICKFAVSERKLWAINLSALLIYSPSLFVFFAFASLALSAINTWWTALDGRRKQRILILSLRLKHFCFVSDRFAGEKVAFNVFM